MSSTKLNKLIKIWYYITLVALAILGIKFVLPILLPFILAAIVAAILKPPINSLETRLNIKRNIISFCLVTLVLLVLISFIGLIFYSIYDWLSDTLEYLPELLPTLTGFTESVTDSFAILGESMPKSVQNMIMQLPNRAIEGATDWITGALSSFAKGLPDSFITIFITILSSYLITRDYNKLSNFVEKTVSENLYNNILKTKQIVSTKIVGIIKSYSIITLLTFLQLYVGFLVLNIKHATAIAAITALVDLLPILGVGVVLVPWALVQLLLGNVSQCVGLLILYAIITVIHNIITPKIVANQIKLDSLTVLATMYIGYSFVGFWGLIFSPLIAAVIRDLIMYEKTEPN